ncbi:hypothetical protein AQUCO_04400074v1 [Aquilegia coerulea]|uniref:STL11/RBM22-like N-terminal domain-containing protein n=1 Tax=Aquilegia coerulea TaxID=218851 RepID=A0A2G5CMU1_AQUCA|nr:hypothetical protein AQUCO_04400074v1 [Aquilegia coerulea]
MANNLEEQVQVEEEPLYMTFTKLCYPCCDKLSNSYSEESYDEECKLCSLPFRVSSWRVFQNSVSEIRKSEICFSCSKLHSVCQRCGTDPDGFLNTFPTLVFPRRRRSTRRRRVRRSGGHSNLATATPPSLAAPFF